jgi:hypothetical protein
MKRQMILLLLVMAAALVGASEAALAEAHKIKTVQCPTDTSGLDCFGTKGRDKLVGRENVFDRLFGKDGSDIYDGKSGGDSFFDHSKNSSDRYLVPSTDFGDLFIEDDGGSSDVLDVSAYKSTDFTYSKFGSDGNQLLMTGAGNREIHLFDFFKKNTIDSFKFSDSTLAPKQVKKKVQ